MASGTGLLKVIEFTPVIETAAYIANDVLFIPQKLTDVFRAIKEDGTSENVAINSLWMLDKDDEVTLDIDFIFSSESISLGAINTVLTVSDADAEKVVAIVNLENVADSMDFASNKLYRKEGLAMQVQGSTKDLWVGGVIRTGNTFTTVSDLVCKVGFTQD